MCNFQYFQLECRHRAHTAYNVYNKSAAYKINDLLGGGLQIEFSKNISAFLFLVMIYMYCTG